MNRKRPISFDKIPVGWSLCPKYGEICCGIFLPSKTPLSTGFSHLYEAGAQYTPSDLLKVCHSKNVGMVVNLSFTDKYYESVELTSCGLEFVRIRCRGHMECPSADDVNEFIDAVANFLQKNKTSRIVVHCSHGYNRSGFMIISYLVLRCGINLKHAIQAFRSCRDNIGIYKNEYIEELYRRYDDVSNTIPASTPPSWHDMGVKRCKEQDDLDGSDNTTADGSSKRGVYRFLKDPKFMDGIDTVSPINDIHEVNRILNKIADLLDRPNLLFPGGQPVSLTQENLELLKNNSYMLSWKADGTRYMMFIEDSSKVYLVDRDNCVYQPSCLQFANPNRLQNTILDGEMVLDKLGNTMIARYLVYDIVVLGGNYVGNEDLQGRFKLIRTAIVEPRNELFATGYLKREHQDFSIRMKPFYSIKYIEQFISSDFISSITHEVDGLIFQPSGPDDVYSFGRCATMLKWKPSHLNTVDFLMKVYRSKGAVGEIPHLVGDLHLGGISRKVCSIPRLDKTYAQYVGNDVIVECKKGGEGFEILRIRKDKSIPNHYSTYESLATIFRFPVTERDLVELAQGYNAVN